MTWAWVFGHNLAVAGALHKAYELGWWDVGAELISEHGL